MKRAAFTVAVIVALAARVVWFAAKGGMHYPDEIFQYLEPAHFRITGDAFLAWELERGARSWLVPAFWGSWMEIGRTIGLRRWELFRFLTLHAAILAAFVVPAARRMGERSGPSSERTRTAVVAAFLAALFPVLGYFAPHTLSELPAMLLLAFAHADWLEAGNARGPSASRAGLRAGVLVGIAVACRVPSALSFPVFACDLLLRRRIDALRALLVGFTIAIAFVGIVDALTWGFPWQSIIVFVNANVQDDALLERAGLAEPWHFYAGETLRTMGPAAPALAALSVYAARKDVRLFVAWTFPLLVLSFLSNKQVRFLVPLLPMLLASAASGVAMLSTHLARKRASLLAAFSTAALVVVGAPAAARLPRHDVEGTFRAQARIGAEGKASGVLVDRGQNANGGYLLLDRSIPLAPYAPELSDHALFDHVIASTPSLTARMRGDPRFEEIAVFGDTALFRRRR